MPLDLSKVDDKKHLIESLTDHFTDIINATITVPDHPQETSFNPNQIKDIKAADPGGEINLIEPPQADNQGNAKLSYPIEAPPGRHGLQPQLSVAYNSDGGNSWMGVGWDLSMQQITVESRWGVPRYISGAESETYLLNGEMLVEETSAGPYLAHRAASFLSPRLSGSVTFHTRVEGQFRRIVRKGTNPQDYRWEVTDKTGMTSYFGGTSSGPDGINSGDTTRLGTDGGNVYMWALKEIRDLNHNFMRYHYQVVNSSPGRQLYMSNITYTGNGSSEGSYGVSFIRDSQASIGARPDSIINAKGGFLQVTADRLHVIEVKLNSNLIRRYKFTYDVGPFNKSRLVKIEQFGSDGTPFAGNIHTFEYFNENVKASDGNYNGYDSAQSWSPFDDGSKAGIPILDDDSSSSLSGSIGDSIGGSAYVGFGPIVPPFKDQSAGPKFGFNHSDSFGLLYMTPLSGTGLPDKVYRKGSNVYFRPNLSGPGSSANDISLSNAQRTFGDNSHVDGLHDLSKEFSDTISAGGESYFGIPIIGNVSFTFSEGKAYFLDVNSDGIPDMVKEGQVYFGHRRLNGTVFYDQDSTTTPNPLVIGSSISSSMFESFEPQHQQKIDMSPMVDTLRRWVAPFNGIIDITAPVSLLQPPALSPDDDPRTDDGVKVSIELDHTGSSPVVLKTVLLKGDTSTGGPDYGAHNDLSISGVHVVQGDRIYFRLQSGDDTASDGTFDQVGWDPQIDYSNVNGHSLPVPQDANNLDPASYQVSKDFTFAGLRQAQTGLGFDGTIRLSGDLVKSDTTTDDITLVISLVSGGVTTVLNAATPNQTLTWDQTGTIGVSSTGAAGGNRDIVVHAHDFLILQVLADSNVDLTKLTFKPLVYYIASTDPKLPSTALFHPITNEPQTKIDMPYDIEFYPDNKLADPQAPITVVRPEFPIPTPIPVYPAPPAFPPNTDPPDTQMTPIPSGEGLLRSQSTLTKNGVTSTDVVITVYAKIPPSTIEVPVFTQTVSSGFTGNMDIAGVFDQLVKTGTTLRVHVDVGTQTDLNKIVWNPTFYYVNPFPPVFTSPPAQAGKISGPADLVTPYCGSGSCTPVIIHTPYDIDLTSTGPLVTRVRYLNVIPSVNVTAGTTGSLIFTIKNGVERLFKESIDLSNVQTDFVTVNVGVVPPLEVTLGDHLYSSFTARDKSLRTKFTATLTGF